MQSINTPEDYMLSLNWNKEILALAKDHLKIWDDKGKELYWDCPKYVMEADLAEKEHYKNCINFWEKRLNEDKSP